MQRLLPQSLFLEAQEGLPTPERVRRHEGPVRVDLVPERRVPTGGSVQVSRGRDRQHLSDGRDDGVYRAAVLPGATDEDVQEDGGG